MNPSETPLTLRPPAARRPVSVLALYDHWYAVCLGADLRSRPITRTLLGIPLVLFRGPDGAPAALLDRCPHRNVPLSFGRAAQGELTCGYHGWRFAADGRCVAIPGLCSEADRQGHRATRFATREQDGLVWVYGRADGEPEHEPFVMPAPGKGYTTVVERVEAPGALFHTIENALDVPHTAFLHGGLFRSADKPRTEIEAVVRAGSESVEAQYFGEPRPTGLGARMLAPGADGEVEHWDRFFLPSITQVEYRLGPKTHLVVTAAMTPVEDFHTVIFASVSFRLGWIPGWLVAPFIKPVARRIFAQDATVLKLQTDALQRFGGEEFRSTEIDVLGRYIWKLMQASARGERGAVAEVRTSLRM